MNTGCRRWWEVRTAGARRQGAMPCGTRAAYKMHKLYRFSPNTYNKNCINITRCIGYHALHIFTPRCICLVVQQSD